MNIIIEHPYWTLALVSFLLNIPCGYIRERHAKFSALWLVWIHASIPLIIALRLSLSTSAKFIPVCIALAIAGQVIGSRWRRHRITRNSQERQQQIPDLLLCKQPLARINDDDVMVVLLNMGGPTANQDVKNFLHRVFADPLLIRFPFSKILQPLFAWLLVTLRWRATAQRYQLIGGGSPIYSSTQAQVDALRQELKRRGRNLDVTFSFNYSQPLPPDTIRELKDAGKRFILPLSLYPHYSQATTGSNLHYLRQAAEQNFPRLSFLESIPYYQHQGYIQAFCDRIQEQLNPDESLSDFYLLFSAHGLPLYFLTEGDPYPFQISQTVALILQRLNRSTGWCLSYQSAVGPMQWLKPSTDDVLRALARRGIKKVLVVPVAFVNDHIETLCEIDMEYRHFAQEIGIKDFRMSKAVEHHPGFISALADSVEAVLPKLPSASQQREIPQLQEKS